MVDDVDEFFGMTKDQRRLFFQGMAAGAAVLFILELIVFLIFYV